MYPGWPDLDLEHCLEYAFLPTTQSQAWLGEHNIEGGLSLSILK